MMNSLIVFVFGYFMGVAVAWIVFRPTKAFQDGYDSAKKHYSNWEKGFNQGWDSALKALGGDHHE